MYAYSFLDEFILIYPFYALLFADSGLSVAQISTLFVLWSLTGVVLEVPSGALADATSRRLLLVVGPLLTAVAFGLWSAIPSYWSFAAGFVLWGIKGALQSGAFEALAYEELDRYGRSPDYARVLGRSRAAGTVGVAAAMVLAGPAYAVTGYPGIGAASVTACIAAALVAVGLPERRVRRHQRSAGESGAQADEPGRADGQDSGAGPVSMLRHAVGVVRRQRDVRLLGLFIVVISAIWGSLDEYVGLLALDIGVSTRDVPLLVLVVYIGVAVGGLAGGAGRRLSRRATGALVAVAAAGLAAGALLADPLGFVLIAAAFGAFQLAEVAASARFQEAISGPARSTVTSLAGLGTEVVTIAIYGVYAAGSLLAGHNVLFAGGAALYLLVALGLGWPPRLWTGRNSAASRRAPR